MKEIVGLLHFFNSGQFGKVRIGDLYEDVILKLGSPEGAINLTGPMKGIHYSMYEFYFKEGKLDSIQNDHWNLKFPYKMEFENDLIIIDPEILSANSVKNLKTIETGLEFRNIKFERINYFNRVALKSTIGVVIDFDNELNSSSTIESKEFEISTLIGIRYFPNLKN